jgi:hypothetical protein
MKEKAYSKRIADKNRRGVQTKREEERDTQRSSSVSAGPVLRQELTRQQKGAFHGSEAWADNSYQNRKGQAPYTQSK